jgi:hypothetical protein
MNLYNSKNLCVSAQQCSSASGASGGRRLSVSTVLCSSVQCVAVRPAVCGSARSSGRQCALQCVAIRATVCGCPAGRVAMCGCSSVVQQCAAVRQLVAPYF